MSDITIPPEALEAAIKAFDESEEDAYVSHADDIRAACLAMLKAWPHKQHGISHYHRVSVPYVRLFFQEPPHGND